MSDFTSGFWNIYIVGITIVSIVACGVLLYLQSKVKVKPGGKGADTTGHVWDGDLEEYNNPLPKWWMNLFWITIVFSAVYLVLYPGLGTFQGVLGWTQVGQYDRERSEADAKVKPLYAKYAAMPIPEVAKDPAARAMGERIFLNNCSQCHGSDAGGAKGFPNLRDGDWLYGGEPDKIVETITERSHGRDAAAGRRARRRRRAQCRRLRPLALRAVARPAQGAARQGEVRSSARPATGRTARATRRSARPT